MIANQPRTDDARDAPQPTISPQHVAELLLGTGGLYDDHDDFDQVLVVLEDGEAKASRVRSDHRVRWSDDVLATTSVTILSHRDMPVAHSVHTLDGAATLLYGWTLRVDVEGIQDAWDYVRDADDEDLEAAVEETAHELAHRLLDDGDLPTHLQWDEDEGQLLNHGRPRAGLAIPVEGGEDALADELESQLQDALPTAVDHLHQQAWEHGHTDEAPEGSE